MKRLRYLHFDVSLGSDERQSLDAMASVTHAQWPALSAEVCLVLGWLHQAFAHQQGPAEEGGAWDVALHASIEHSQAQDVQFDPQRLSLQLRPTAAQVQRYSLSLTLSAEPEVVAGLSAEFGLALD
jgi:hypothetical protein